MPPRKKRAENRGKKEVFFDAYLACTGNLKAVAKKLNWSLATTRDWAMDDAVMADFREWMRRTELQEIYMLAQHHCRKQLTIGEDSANTMAIFLMKGLHPNDLDEGVRRQRLANEGIEKAAKSLKWVDRAQTETPEQWLDRTEKSRKS